MKINFIDAGALFNTNDNYKTNNFNILLKQIVVKELKEKGATTMQQAKTLQSVERIESAFKPYLKNNEVVIGKSDLFNILRTKLHYRTRSENISVVRSKIGSCFDVSYCKKEKKYTLKKEVLKNNLYIEKKRKKGTTTSPLIAIHTDVF